MYPTDPPMKKSEGICTPSSYGCAALAKKTKEKAAEEKRREKHLFPLSPPPDLPLFSFPKRKGSLVRAFCKGAYTAT